MPRGKGRGRGSSSGHKGQRRVFTSPEQEEAQRQKTLKEKEWKKRTGDESDESSEEGDQGASSAFTKPQPQTGEVPPSSSSEEEETDSEEEDAKPKGVAHLIESEIQNPNHVKQKQKKVTDISIDSKDGKPELSRREREAIDKEKAKIHYEKLQLQGKTDQARADLARLALIKKNREDAARKREEEKKQKEEAEKAKAKK